MTVTQPSGSTVVRAGNDYATQQLDDPWDMSNNADIDVYDSGGITNAAISGGLFSADTTSGDNSIYPLFEGFGGSLNTSRGFLHPIDTAVYRYFTLKMKVARANELELLYFLQGDSGSVASHNCGQTHYANGTYWPASVWVIYTYDLVTSSMNTNGTNCPHQWTDFATVQGLDFVPALDGTNGGAHFDIDWIRLTAPASPTEKTTVQWTDSGYSQAYTVTLNETGANAASYVLTTTASGTSYLADLSVFPPGSYTITVARSSGAPTPNTSAAFRINAPPQIVITAPDEHGDQSRNFAQVVVGNPWGPITSADFSTVSNFNNVSYSTPVGSFYGRPKNSDPQWYMNLGGHAIDTSLYRSLCFTMKDFGPYAVGEGSVARFFWGTGATGLTTSQDIPVYPGLNEYCFPDIAQVPVESDSTAGPWTGNQTIFRLDPNEFTVSPACINTPSPSNCHDVQLDSVILSPFAQANPTYTFSWTVTDADDASISLHLYLDPDTDPNNGNEITVDNAIVATGNNTFAWSAPASVPYGTYHVFAIVDDGTNAVTQYSTGVIVVGARDGIFRNGFDITP